MIRKFEYDGTLYEGIKVNSLEPIAEIKTKTNDVVFVSDNIKATYPMCQKELDRGRNSNGL